MSDTGPAMPADTDAPGVGTFSPAPPRPIDIPYTFARKNGVVMLPIEGAVSYTHLTLPTICSV